MAKKNLLLAIILSLLFALVIGIGLDLPKGRSLTARYNPDLLGLNGRTLALLASSRQLAVSFGR